MSRELDLHAVRVEDAFRRFKATLNAAEEAGLYTTINVPSTTIGIGGDILVAVPRSDLAVSVSSYEKREIAGE